MSTHHPTGAIQINMKSAKGLTIVEILTAMMVGIIVVGAIYSMIIIGRKSAGAVELKSVADQDVRAALEIMVMEIQMASYNPTHQVSIWRNYKDPKNFFSLEQGNKGIQEATATSITVEMDLNANEVIAAGGQDENEVIRYEYINTGDNRYITRSTNGGPAQAFLGAAAKSPATQTVRVVNGDTPIFQYYDGSNRRIVADLAANLPNIRRVEITLVVETDEISPDSGQRRQMTYTTSVIPRNHAFQ